MKYLAPALLVTLILGACATQQQPANPPVANSNKQDSGDKVASVDLTKTQPVNNTGTDPLHDPKSLLSQRLVQFDYDAFVVKSDYRDLLAAHAQYLATHPAARLVIQGHADERGSAEYNLALGQKRANAVREVLNAQGIADKQLETVSFGEEKPLDAGHDEAAWARNRRAQLVYSGEVAQ
ncbi:peptidoglycan-associated lipoprotein [Andreprevotia lacus DSM 23236]|jgi:peptidoglycan-associated lipoprotein|uniref:Peptidoglycan-associated lipoprotein n=1 Tax=Andreprevotia lacus DSM 23236 TaxID=1121001 RepID=A0A1W1XVG9_9NEIS|nr:peptidoglycan-associated lipoprotein Pal [Andreprevotia lacus]SMC27862.1 peptidoglycan-associated lipoprotein [Andreprevotia lacus DSM 23236]